MIHIASFISFASGLFIALTGAYLSFESWREPPNSWSDSPLRRAFSFGAVVGYGVVIVGVSIVASSMGALK